MTKTPTRLITVLLLIVAVVVLLAPGLSATVMAAGVSPNQCADTKANCQKKNGGGSDSQTNQNTSTPAQDQACQGFNAISSGVTCDQSNGGNNGQSDVGKAVGTVISVLSYVAGILGIIFIMLSGFRYITSSGDQNKVANAKTTLVYALIGLAIAGLSQILVHTVLSQAASLQ